VLSSSTPGRRTDGGLQAAALCALALPAGQVGGLSCAPLTAHRKHEAPTIARGASPCPAFVQDAPAPAARTHGALPVGRAPCRFQVD